MSSVATTLAPDDCLLVSRESVLHDRSADILQTTEDILPDQVCASYVSCCLL